jgi:hypothetical protein
MDFKLSQSSFDSKKAALLASGFKVTDTTFTTPDVVLGYTYDASKETLSVSVIKKTSFKAKMVSDDFILKNKVAPLLA